MLKHLYRFDLFVTSRTYVFLALLFIVYVLAFPFPFLMELGNILSMILSSLGFLDLILLVAPAAPLTAKRTTQLKWSIGAENRILLEVKNRAQFFWNCTLIDEIPLEFQSRNFKLKLSLSPGELWVKDYFVRPLNRGEYKFGKIRIFLRTPLGFFSRRLSIEQNQMVSVYPGIQQMKQHEMYSLQHISLPYGVKKMRRLGQSYEFEQIKDYVVGDDMRHINWKATARTKMLKTNHFIEERSQPVYCVIDKSRVMNLSFDGIRILDHAINAGLVILNTALRKGDKAGLITFSDKIGTALRADNHPGTLSRILESLYHQKYRQTESDFEFLYKAVGRVIRNRSLVFLFTHFETISSLERALPVMRKLNYNHLLVVVLIQNAELKEFAFSETRDMSGIYDRIVAKQMLVNQEQMQITFRNYGIQTILSHASELSLDTVNKYLELKAKGLI